jgi:LuxR family quorum-sensing transcriptional regulator LasR
VQFEDFATLFTSTLEQSWANEVYLITKKLGFDQTLFAVLRSKNDAHQTAFLKSNYSQSWRSQYEQNAYSYIDPVVSHCCNSITPIVWTPELFTHPKELELYEGCIAYGLRDGIAFPVHGANNEVGIFTFVSEGLSRPKDREELLRALPILSILRDFVYETSLKFAGAHQRNLAIKLTPREKEILEWTMAGKSMWEISKILNCSESNVNFHITNIRQKFGVITKQQAVIKAIQLGILKL